MSSETDLFKLQQELQSLREQRVSLTDQLRARDMAEVARVEAAKPKDNFELKFAQQFVEKELANPAFVEDYRKAAWREAKVFMVDHPPEYREGGWPENLTAEIYINRSHGLNDDGDALVGEKPPEPEPTKLSPWLEAGIARAKEGKS
jgi:hypothetical protein